MSDKKTAIIICGPTAVGKTDYAFRLAEKYHTQILSADSRQCYRELDIGVAKPEAEKLQAVRHYFINSHSIADEVTAAGFERYGLKALEEIFSQSDVAIVAGGTGLYVKVLIEGLDEIPQTDPLVEKSLREKWLEGGMPWLTAELGSRDARFATSGEMRNPQRMLRALAVKITTGKSILDFHTAARKERPFNVQKILLEAPRDLLYNRINQRVDRMVEDGLIEEAQKLFPQRSLNALQTIGYRELFDSFEGKITLERAIELIRQNTRHYAKRQITWLNKYFRDDQTRIITSLD
ncbi:MAG: tRNA (adenosine(37)-N6)-dimethylallyltransferase MiaA [Chitinophagaceae bacterium]|nr:tRNA (adenosine(37)-N6)-dimethylallyltransferase MiaA [Chitinophagaceae bacterium]